MQLPYPDLPRTGNNRLFTTQLQSFCVKFLSLIYYILHLPPPFLSSLFTKKDECFVTFVRIWLIFVVFRMKNRSGGPSPRCRHKTIRYKHGNTFVLPQITTLNTIVLPKPTFGNSRITIFPRAKRRCRQSACIYAPCGRRCDSRKPRRARGKLCTIDKNHIDNQRQSQANFINSSILFNGRNTADMYLPRVPSTSFWEASGKSMLFSRA